MSSLNEIRSSFLNYFEKNGHSIVPSSALVPRNDPTLMFVNSGMVQFKNLFTGIEHRDYQRATTAQKCVRAGGKHNDLDNVGYTARHHTFFEMLGNFSFGDYFKEEAIALAWKLITQEFGIPANRLYTTVYHTDDEAFSIWKKLGVPEERIIRIATSDNFWQMGPTGPCGPCTEIFYDHGAHIAGGPPGSADEDGDRFIEIWNIVFMQNEQFEDGSLKPLEMQSIDTGMGLERIGALLQGSHDNYETDLFRSLIEASASVTGSDPYGDKNVHHRVIADHLRSTSFLIADGVMPSNEGRGYVLRRIMRRAMRHAHLLGASDPVMYRLVPSLIANMGAAYPELGNAQLLIEETLKAEETRFKLTLERGLRLLADEVDELADGAALPGETAFKLYDTYGFPLDLTEDALREMGRGVDREQFEAAMADQKAKARAAWSGSGDTANSKIWFEIADESGTTEFLGYETDRAEAQILAIVKDGERVDRAVAGEKIQFAVNQTPFYAESGGQVGDTGQLSSNDAELRINDTKKVAGVFIHVADVVSGSLSVGDAVELSIDPQRRSSIRSSHSATHLLHEALRKALGDHVSQRGSLNAPDRLRFDFSHGDAIGADVMGAVEAEVNAFIRQNSEVETRIMTPDDARALGAQALFGEKYGDEVRVVSMGKEPESGKGTDKQTYSLELCGGTHVRRTGDIGAFVTVSETASSSGVRRIEALTGSAALTHLREQGRLLNEAAGELKAPAQDLSTRLRSLLEERKAMAAELSQLRRALALAGDGAGKAEAIEDVKGVSFLCQTLDGVNGKELAALIDGYKDRHGSVAVLLFAENNGKVAVAAGVSSDLLDRVSAIALVKTAVEALGGKGGGGRPDFAQGGAKSLDKVDAAIAAAKDVIV